MFIREHMGSAVREPSVWTCWLTALWEVLQTDDEVCLDLIGSAGGHAGAVHLLEGEASAADALAYARTLSELGYGAEAVEILGEVLRVAFGGVSGRPLVEPSASLALA